MVTLALDTSHPVGSVALARDGALMGGDHFREPASHLVALGHAVDHVLGQAGFDTAAIDRIAVVTGPGSFTGLRIGLSFAKGLHAARGIPLVAMDTLRLLALPWLKEVAGVAAMIDARRGEVYAAMYERDPGDESDPAAARVVAAPQAVGAQSWLSSLGNAPGVFVGTGAVAHREMIRNAFPGTRIIDADNAYPSTAHLAMIAHRMQPLDEDGMRALEPFYIRSSGAEQAKLRAHTPRSQRDDG